MQTEPLLFTHKKNQENKDKEIKVDDAPKTEEISIDNAPKTEEIKMDAALNALDTMRAVIISKLFIQHVITSPEYQDTKLSLKDYLLKKRWLDINDDQRLEDLKDYIIQKMGVLFKEAKKDGYDAAHFKNPNDYSDSLWEQVYEVIRTPGIEGCMEGSTNSEKRMQEEESICDENKLSIENENFFINIHEKYLELHREGLHLKQSNKEENSNLGWIKVVTDYILLGAIGLLGYLSFDWLTTDVHVIRNHGYYCSFNSEAAAMGILSFLASVLGMCSLAIPSLYFKGKLDERILKKANTKQTESLEEFSNKSFETVRKDFRSIQEQCNETQQKKLEEAKDLLMESRKSDKTRQFGM